MAGHRSNLHYHFTTHWRVKGTVAEVADILANGPDLPRWWPSVYLAVQEIEPGDADSIGKIIDLYTKGWLPYTLRWQACVTENKHPYGFSFAASGDFIGRGVWVFSQEGPDVDIVYDWDIVVGKPLLRRLSFLLKPFFEANHHWAMKQGERSLRLELDRRRATTERERAAVPPPPGPTFAFNIRRN